MNATIEISYNDKLAIEALFEDYIDRQIEEMHRDQLRTSRIRAIGKNLEIIADMLDRMNAADPYKEDE